MNTLTHDFEELITPMVYPLESESIVWFIHEDGVFAGQSLIDPELFMTESEFNTLQSDPTLAATHSPFLPDQQWELLVWDYIEGRLVQTPIFEQLPPSLQTELSAAWERFQPIH